MEYVETRGLDKFKEHSDITKEIGEVKKNLHLIVNYCMDRILGRVFPVSPRVSSPKKRH